MAEFYTIKAGKSIFTKNGVKSGGEEIELTERQVEAFKEKLVPDQPEATPKPKKSDKNK